MEALAGRIGGKGREGIIMIFVRVILGQELILIGAIGLALGLMYIFLRQWGHLDLLRRVWLPSLLWAIFGPLDALVTMVGTWGDPSREGNPSTRAFLYWGGWVGLVLGTFLYVLLWAAVVMGLEALRWRIGGVWAGVLGGMQLLILYALAVGHFLGFFSWTPYSQPFWPLINTFYAHDRWLFTTSPLGYLLYFGLAVGALFTALHLAIVALLRGMGIQYHARVARVCAGATSVAVAARRGVMSGARATIVRRVMRDEV